MSTKALLGLVAAVVVIGGGAWYLSSTPRAQAPGGAITSETEGKGSATFADFIAQGGSRTCDITVNTPEAPATGIVYVSGSDVRADFTTRPTALNGTEVRAHMIQTGGYVYSWTDMLPQGVKVAVTESSGAAASQGFDLNSQVEYSCAPWIVDASKFKVPETITFMEFNAEGGFQGEYPN